MTYSFRQFVIYWCKLEPTFGHQLQKTRPCVIVSPKEMNDILETVIIVPLTSTVRSFPFYIPIAYSGKAGALACDQIKVIDKRRVGDKLAVLNNHDIQKLSQTLSGMFQIKI